MLPDNDELVRQALGSVQSAQRLHCLRQVRRCTRTEFHQPLLAAAAKEGDEAARAELLRVAILIASHPDNTALLSGSFTTAWGGLADAAKMETLAPLIAAPAAAQLPAAIQQTIIRQLTAAETKHALKTSSCLAWALALTLSIPVTPQAEAFLANRTLLAPSALATPERLLAVTLLITTLLRLRPSFFATAMQLPLDSTDFSQASHLAVASLLQAIHFAYVGASAKNARFVEGIKQAVSSSILSVSEDTRQTLLNAFVTLTAHGILDRASQPPLAASHVLSSLEPVIAGARRYLAYYLMRRAPTSAAISSAIWALLAAEKRDTRRKANRQVSNLIYEARLAAPEPADETLPFFAKLLDNPVSQHKVQYFINFMSEARLHKWNSAVVHDWAEWYTTFLDRHILGELNLTAPLPVPAFKPKTGATPKTGAAKSKAPPAAIAAPSPRNQGVVARLEVIEALLRAWPLVGALRESELLNKLRELIRANEKIGDGDVTLKVRQVLEVLCDTYASSETIPERRLLPQLLYTLMGSRERCDLAAAERICATLHESKALSTEASRLVLPIILALLAPNNQDVSSVSLVAVHRAVATIAFQLRLGTRLDPDTLLAIMRGVQKDKPSLIPLCEKMVPVLPAETAVKDLADLLDCPNAPFRLAVVARLVTGDIESAPPSVLARLLVAKYDSEESIRSTVARIELAPVPLEVTAKLLASQTSVYQKAVARAMACTYERDEIVSCAMSTFSKANTGSDESIPEQLRGFRLTAKDMARLRAKAEDESKGKCKVNRTHVGCALVLGAVTRQGQLPETCALQILTFLINEALRLLRPASLDAIEEELKSACEAAIESLVMNSADEVIFKALCEFLKKPQISNAGRCAAVRGLSLMRPSSDLSELFIELLTTSKPALAFEVKRAITRALPPLLKDKGDLATLTQNAETLALEARQSEDKIAGALFLAACIRASGWAAYGGVERLQLLVDERKDVGVRYGVYLTIEFVVDLAGRAIEPQARELVAMVMTGNGDSKLEIRESSHRTSRGLMRALAGSSSLREVLSTLLELNNSSSWRTKVGAIDMLTHLAASSTLGSDGLLRQILPVLMDAAHAAHKDVREASVRALRTLLAADADGVLRHPDMQALGPVILKALQDTSETHLLQFLRHFGNLRLSHKLDAASVCIVHLLLLRSLKLSSGSGARGEIRERACQLIGVLPLLCEDAVRDYAPLVHRDQLLTELFRLLGAPTPLIRQTCARCIGLLSEALGPTLYLEVLPYLIKNLRTVNNSVERSGCANAFVEVLRPLGHEALAKHLPDILKQAGGEGGAALTAREGFLGLFVYFPLILGDDFKDFVPTCLPVLITGLEAREESVRDIAFRAIRIFVQQYGASHTPLLLAPIEAALFNLSPEVRLRAVELLGSLVDKILKGAQDSTYEGGELMQLDILSLERRSYVLSAMYIVRTGDEDAEVRQSASSIWKGVVANTPRTVRELLPLLSRRLIDLLGSGDILKESTAARCMSAVVAMHGDKLMPDVIANFKKALQAGKVTPAVRGALLGTQSVVQSSPPLALRRDLPEVYSVIEQALSLHDEILSIKEEVVRTVVLIAAAEAAAEAELANQSRKTQVGGKKAQSATSRTKSTSEALTVRTRLIEPLLATIDTPLEPREVANLVETFKLFMKMAPNLVVSDVLKRCKSAELTESKLQLLATLGEASSEVVMIQLRPVCRLIAAALSPSNADTLIPPMRQVFEALVSALHADDIKIALASTLTDMLELHEARMRCTAEDWRAIGPIPVCTAEAMIAQTQFEDREPREGAAWGRCVTICVAGAVWKAGRQTELWQNEVASLLTPPLLDLTLTDLNRHVVAEGAIWLANMTKVLDRTLQVPVAFDLCRALQRASKPALSDGGAAIRLQLPGLEDRAGLEAVAALLQPAFLYGAVDVKERVAVAFELLIALASPTVLAQSAVKIAGQLIRGFAERAPSAVKVHILGALHQLLARVGAPLRLLVPQLQSTFMRCIGEPELGEVAAASLILLSNFAGPRVNLLASELAKTLRPDEPNYPALLAVEGILRNAGSALTPASLTQLRCALAALPEPPIEALETLDRLLD